MKNLNSKEQFTYALLQVNRKNNTTHKYIIIQFNTYIMLMHLDEEIGGQFGMVKFVTTSEFAALNIGFTLDEGVASPNEVFNVFYCERTGWRTFCISLKFDKIMNQICIYS